MEGAVLYDDFVYGKVRLNQAVAGIFSGARPQEVTLHHAKYQVAARLVNRCSKVDRLERRPSSMRSVPNH